MEFQRILLEVGHRLSEANVEALRFLCVDLLDRDLSFTSSKQLFNLLMDSDFLSSENTSLLTELLHICKRYDLMKRFQLRAIQQPGESRVGPYRKLLFDLSENVTDDDLKSMKFLLRETLPRKKLNDGMTTLELLREMEKEDLLSSENLDVLKSILDKVCPSLTKQIDKYKRETNHHANQRSNRVNNIGPISQETVGGKLSVSEMVTGSHEETFSPHPSYIPSEESNFCEVFNSSTEVSGIVRHPEHPESLGGATGHLANLSLQSCTDDDEVQSFHLSYSSVSGNVNLKQGNSPSSTSAADMDLPKYAMNRDKRGICLIINNYDFSKSNTPLKIREGTQYDEAKLKKVFEWLSFKVEVHRDLSQKTIRTVLNELKERDHSQMDCFVCCVLSHGLEGTVYGVDGNQVQLRELTQPFTGNSCLSLRGKPKLFFIQACQGIKEQEMVLIQSDCPRPRSLSTDAIVPKNSIPSDADFLLGMATIPDYASFRDTREGTWFIQTLCEMLRSLVPKGVDLLSILTEVNNEVSKKTAGTPGNSKKQMPQPVYTLRKRVVFPIPNCPEQTSL